MKHILIVDDDPSRRKIMVLMMGELLENATIAQAETLEDAQRRFGDQQPDLIFMDGQFPRNASNRAIATLGPELTTHLRQLGYQGYIVAYSGDPDVRRQMMDAGCNFELAPNTLGPLSAIEEILKRANLLGGS